MSEWENPELAKEYAKKVANAEINWYEYEVNLPALITLMPVGVQSVLDYGCGAGDITVILAKKFTEVEGSDSSQGMINIAKRDYPDVKIFKWDGTAELQNKQGYYDVVFSKLVVQFIDDLDGLARQLNSVLKPEGHLVFSVPHPLRTVIKTKGEYWQQTLYSNEIGSYGIEVTMIHRSLRDYVKPFTKNGFVLEVLDEPVIPNDVGKKYNQTPEDMNLPKRLNLRFRKIKK